MSGSTDTTQISAEEASAFSLLARKALEQNKARLTAQKPTNGRAASMAADLGDVSTLVRVTAPFILATAGIYTRVATNSPMDVGGTPLQFQGTAWGLGLGAGIVWLTGWVEPANVLLGDVDFIVTATPASTQLSFGRDGDRLGLMIGIGLNVQNVVAAGKGEFTRA
jgi:hypothetical protein